MLKSLLCICVIKAEVSLNSMKLVVSILKCRKWLHPFFSFSFHFFQVSTFIYTNFLLLATGRSKSHGAGSCHGETENEGWPWTRERHVVSGGRPQHEEFQMDCVLLVVSSPQNEVLIHVLYLPDNKNEMVTLPFHIVWRPSFNNGHYYKTT